MAGSNRSPAPVNAHPAWVQPEMSAQGHDEQMGHWPQGQQPAPAWRAQQPHGQQQQAYVPEQAYQNHVPGFDIQQQTVAPAPQGYAADQLGQRPEWAPHAYDRQPGTQAYPASTHPHNAQQQPNAQYDAGYLQASHGQGTAPAQGTQQGWEHNQHPHAQGQQGHYGYAGHQGQTGHGYDQQAVQGQQTSYDPRYAHWQDPSQQRDPAYNLDQYGQPVSQQAYDDQQLHAQAGYDGQGEFDSFEDGAEEPERRRPRTALVVGALVGAIAVGGGLAYGYRMLGNSKDSQPPIVKADKSPAKVKPADQGGKDIANTDKKFLNRLTEDGKATVSAAAVPTGPASPTPAANSSNEPEAPRKVTTLVVNRDGTLTPQPSAPALVPPPPGMVVEGGSATTRSQLRGPASDPQAAAEPPALQAAPRVAELPLPKVKAQPAEAPIAVSAAQSAAAPTPVKKAPRVRDDLPAQQKTASTTASVAQAAPAQASVAGPVLGYVPVLVSKKSREEALRSLADLHQKYPDVMQNKAPDVVEANIPDKGLYYRLILGPPGSRESARDVCNKLETQGYKGCWATAYRQ